MKAKRAPFLLMCLWAVFASGVVFAQPEPELSNGCRLANNYHVTTGTLNFINASWFKGERIHASASEPTFGSPSGITLEVGGIEVDSDAFPGELDYVFPEDALVLQSLQFGVVGEGLVTWDIQCYYDQPPPATPVPTMSPKGLAVLVVLLMAVAYYRRRALIA